MPHRLSVGKSRLLLELAQSHLLQSSRVCCPGVYLGNTEARTQDTHCCICISPSLMFFPHVKLLILRYTLIGSLTFCLGL